MRPEQHTALDLHAIEVIEFEAELFENEIWSCRPLRWGVLRNLKDTSSNELLDLGPNTWVGQRAL